MAYLEEYQHLLQSLFQEYINLSNNIGNVVNEQAALVKNAFDAQYEFLQYVAVHPKPADLVIQQLLEPTSSAMTSIQTHREKNRTSSYFNHLSAVSESISILGWVVVTLDPSKYAKELHGAGAYFGNKVITAYKDKNTLDSKWAKVWLDVLAELGNIIRKFYRCGLNWNAAGTVGAPPPPPPPMAPIGTPLGNIQNVSDSRTALLRDLNRGADITKGLKKVDKAVLSSKASAGKASSSELRSPKDVKVLQKLPPKLELDGRKWCVEYQEKNENLIIQDTTMNQSVYMYKCNFCQLVVKGKVNCITLDSCKKIAIVFDDLVSSLEILNCERIKAQPLGKVPTIIIDKSEGVMLYLSNSSFDTEVISSKSSEINLCLPDEENDYAEVSVPEQFKTVIVRGKPVTTAIEKI